MDRVECETRDVEGTKSSAVRSRWASKSDTADSSHRLEFITVYRLWVEQSL